MLIVRWANGQRVQYNSANFCKYLPNGGCELYTKQDGAWVVTLFGGGFAVEAIEACSAQIPADPGLEVQRELTTALAKVLRAQAKTRSAR